MAVEGREVVVVIRLAFRQQLNTSFQHSRSRHHRPNIAIIVASSEEGESILFSSFVSSPSSGSHATTFGHSVTPRLIVCMCSQPSLIYYRLSSLCASSLDVTSLYSPSPSLPYWHPLLYCGPRWCIAWEVDGSCLCVG